MAVAKANAAAIVEGGTYTPAAGSNRVVVFAGSGESSFSSRPLVGLSFGGASCTPAVTFSADGNVKGGIFYILEANIPAGASTLVADWGGQTHAEFVGSAYTLTGVDQATPVSSFNSAVAASSALIDLAVTSEDGSAIIAAIGTNSDINPGFDLAATNTASTATYVADNVQDGPSGLHQGGGISSIIATGQAETVGLRWGSTYNVGGAAAVFAASAAATPTITDIDTDESVYPGQSYIIQATDDIGATAGTVFWERLDGSDSVQHTVTNWDAATDQITVTAVRGGHNYGAGLYRARVVLADTTEILFDNAGAGLTLEAEPGTFAVTAASPNTTDDASLWTGLIDTATGDPVTVVDGDQAWVNTLIDGLAIAPDGTITANETGSFTVQFWKASEGVWGSDQTVTFTASSGGLTDLELKKKQNKRRRYTANLLGAWRNRFIGERDE